MSPASPTWGDVEGFLRADGWREIPAGERGGRRRRHIHFEKVLPDRRVLRTHISHSRGKTVGRDRFRLILREQLEVSADQFWAALASGEPVERPAELDEPERRVEHPAWVVAVLVGELHMSAAEIAKLTEQEAKRLVHEHWSRQRD